MPDTDRLAEPKEPTASAATRGSLRVQDMFASYAILVGSFLVGQVLGLVGLTIVSHRVGPAGLGEYGYALNLATYFGLPLMPGFALLGIRRIATADKSRRPQIVAELQTLSIVNGGLALLVLTVGAGWLTPSPHVARLVPILGLTLVLNGIAVEWALQGLQRARLIGLYRLLGQVVYVAIIVSYVAIGHVSVVRYAWANFAGLAVTAFLEVVCVWRIIGPPRLQGPERPFVETRAIRRLLSATLPLAVSSVMLQVYYYSDVIILGQIKSSTAVGLYTAAGRIPLAMLTLSSMWGTVFFPHAVQLWKEQREQLMGQARHFGTLAVLLAVPTVPIAFAVGPDALGQLFGVGFRPGGVTFGLLVAFAAVALVNVNVSNLLLASGRDRVYVAFVCGAAAVNIGLNFVFVPRWGATGAALASVVAEAASLMFSATYVSLISGKLFVPIGKRAALCLGPLLCTTIWLLLTASWEWLLRAAIGMSLYFGLVYLIRGIRPSDFKAAS